LLSLSQNGTIHIFWKGTDAQLWHEWHDVAGWAGPEPLGAAPDGSTPAGSQLTSDPSPVVSSADVVDVFWRGTDRMLWHKAWVGSTWRGPEPIGVPTNSAPCASGQPSGRVDVFYVAGSQNQVWHEWNYGGVFSWYGPEALGGSVQ
jgi:hypothetical protein